MSRDFEVMEEYPYLDKGYIKLLNVTGTDQTVVMAARTSYGQPQAYESVDMNTGLISYLREHHHTSCFELCNVTIQIKLPLFVAAQVDRHRTARQNQMSARYTELPKDYWIPCKERMGGKSKTHKQGTGEPLADDIAQQAINIIEQNSKQCLDNYEKLLSMGVANEIARATLAVNFYTIKVWQMDLNNLMKFITLRWHPTAQQEIAEMAAVLADIVKKYFPQTWAAYENHVRNTVTFSELEMKVIKEAFAGIISENDETNKPFFEIWQDQLRHSAISAGMSKRRIIELFKKFEE